MDREKMAGMIQLIEQRYDEKIAMYMRLSKKELAKMLISCNDNLDIVIEKLNTLDVTNYQTVVVECTMKPSITAFVDTAITVGEEYNAYRDGYSYVLVDDLGNISHYPVNCFKIVN